MTVGVLARALSWVALTELHASVAIAVLVAAIFLGLVIAPVARRRHLRSDGSRPRANRRQLAYNAGTDQRVDRRRHHRHPHHSRDVRRPGRPEALIDRSGGRPRWQVGWPRARRHQPGGDGTIGPASGSTALPIHDRGHARNVRPRSPSPAPQDRRRRRGVFVGIGHRLALVPDRRNPEFRLPARRKAA